MEDLNEIEKPRFNKWWDETYLSMIKSNGKPTHAEKFAAHKAWMAKAWDSRNSFESKVRKRFHNIINGEGSMIPRIAIKTAVDNIFGNLPNKQINSDPK